MAKSDFTLHLDPDDYARVMNSLNGLTTIEKDAVVIYGLKEGAKILVEQGKANILQKDIYDTGKLYESVAVQVKKKSGKVYAGFKYGTGSGGAVAHLVEAGTKVRSTKKGYNRGKVTATHFWKEAVDSKRDAAMKEVMDSIEISINKIINRNK